MAFAFFDPEQEVVVTHRRLPHWYQPGVTYFITFRTIDSLPANVMRQWNEERGDWLRRHNIDPFTSNWREALQQLPATTRNEFHNRFTDAFHRYLDAGYGACLLKRHELAQIVATSLLHFDGQRYQLGDFVVMPNHVHLLVCLIAPTGLKEQCRSWKKYTSTRINQVTGRRDHFWQGEGFDHLVRSPEQYAHFQRYIAENPRKAMLCEGEYLLYQRADTMPDLEEAPHEQQVTPLRPPL
jgi:REP element-mobilizing transposase RayT